MSWRDSSRTTAHITVLSLIACALIACDGTPEPADDAGTGEPDAFVAPPECTDDAECEDGLFCTGVETCVEGRCRREPMICDDAIECTNDYCSEERHRCEHAAPDADADGFADVACVDGRGDPLGTDCDDTDATRFPGNAEVCDADGHDEDCDLDTRGGLDADADGYESRACCNPEITTGTPNCGDDCDDARAAVSPVGTEVCDGLDQDCDGEADDGVALAGFIDGDRDGRGDDARPAMRCAGAVGFATEGGDCDDANVAVSPTQPEICDGIRNDCTAADPDVGAGDVDWFTDRDGDGFGSARSGVTRSCAPITGASLLSSDCDDDEPAVSPAAAEMCDGVDNDCSGAPDFRIGLNDLEDDDRDGVVDRACTPLGTDCDDADAVTGPGEPERCDGRDNDCDGEVDEGASSFVYYRDVDGDGFGSAASGSIVGCMTIEGYVPRGADCDDASPTRYPTAPERCNLRDEDCDGAIDEATGGGGCPNIEDQVHTGGDVGYGYATPRSPIGQTFTVGVSGQLVGLDIEMGLRDVADARFDARIEVRNPSGAVVATRIVNDVDMPNPRVRVQPGVDSPTYLDLSAEEIIVRAGEVWSFWVMSVPGDDTCNVGLMSCTSRSMPCFSDADCGGEYIVAIADSDYPGGTMFCGGEPCSSYDAYFRTVVHPR